MPPLHDTQNTESPSRAAVVRPAKEGNARARLLSPDLHPNGPVVLVLAADEQFAIPLSVTLYSALVNLRESSGAVVYIIDGGIETASRQRLRSVAERAHSTVRLEFVAPEPQRLETYTLRVEGRFSPAVFLRLFIPELLPTSCEKAIYLDSDTIVEKDLTQLWQTEMGEYALLAARERNVASQYGLYNWRELGLDPDAPYFNSGILVFNLRRWRDENISSAVLGYLSQHSGKLNLPHEQEGLNAVLAGRWGTLDPRWNLMYPFYDAERFESLPFADVLRDRREEFTSSAHIIHFNTAEKPWHPSCAHPARTRFFEYLKRSEWFNPIQYFRFRTALWPSQTVAAIRHDAKERLHRLATATRLSLRHVVSSGDNGRSNVAEPTESIVLVFAVDESFAMPMAVTLYSALVNLRTDRGPRVYVVDSGISQGSRQRILRIALRAHSSAQVEFVQPDEERLSAYTLTMERRFSKSIFFRLLIPELLPDDIEKAIYLDSDMVVEQDLNTLWQIEMGNHAVLAVQDFAIPHVSSMPRGLYNWKDLGLSHDAPYFNSGLLVLNLRCWRQENIGERILEYLSLHRDHLNMHGNQEGFNAVLANRWAKLDARWNLIHHVYDPVLFKRSNAKHSHLNVRRQLTRTPYLIHFTALRKPWEPDCVHPARNRFFHYLKKSGWFTRADYVRLRMRLVPRQAKASLRHLARARGRPFKQTLRSILQSGSSAS